MTANSKQTALRRAVVELIGHEGRLERALGARLTASAADAEVGEALRQFGRTAGEDVRLRVQRAEEEPTEVRVRRPRARPADIISRSATRRP